MSAAPLPRLWARSLRALCLISSDLALETIRATAGSILKGRVASFCHSGLEWDREPTGVGTSRRAWHSNAGGAIAFPSPRLLMMMSRCHAHDSRRLPMLSARASASSRRLAPSTPSSSPRAEAARSISRKALSAYENWSEKWTSASLNTPRTRPSSFASFLEDSSSSFTLASSDSRRRRSVSNAAALAVEPSRVALRSRTSRLSVSPALASPLLLSPSILSSRSLDLRSASLARISLSSPVSLSKSPLSCLTLSLSSSM